MTKSLIPYLIPERLKVKNRFLLKNESNCIFEVTSTYQSSLRAKLITGKTTMVKNFDDTYTVLFYKHKFLPVK